MNQETLEYEMAHACDHCGHRYAAHAETGSRHCKIGGCTCAELQTAGKAKVAITCNMCDPPRAFRHPDALSAHMQAEHTAPGQSLESVPCERCGEPHFIVGSFHHLYCKAAELELELRKLQVQERLVEALGRYCDLLEKHGVPP